MVIAIITMKILFDEPVLIVAAVDTFMLVAPGEEWSKDDLFAEFPKAETLDVIPLGAISNAQERLERVNKVIDDIQAHGVEHFNNSYTIPKQVH